MSLTCLRSQIDFFPKGGPPRPALPFPFSSKRKKQRRTAELILRIWVNSHRLTSAELPPRKLVIIPASSNPSEGWRFSSWTRPAHSVCVPTNYCCDNYNKSNFSLPISTSVSSLFPHSDLPPCHKGFGLESHSRHVKLDFKRHRTRILASVRSQDASFLRCR